MTTIDVTVGAWSSTAEFGVPEDWEAPAILVDALDAAWSSDPNLFPAQPDPTTLAFTLYVPHVAAGPQLRQGDAVEFVIGGPGWDGIAPPFFEFVGRVSDVEAVVRRDGLAYHLTAVDHTAEPAEDRIGDTPWPQERWDSRWAAVAAACNARTGLTFDTTVPYADGGAFASLIAARDVDAQRAADVIDDLLSDSAAWRSIDATLENANVVDPENPMRGPRQRWFRPILCQDVDASGAVTFRLGMIGKGERSAEALPYRLALDPVDGLVAVRKPAPNHAVEPVAVIPSSAVDRNGLAWRQDKARTPNRVRLTGEIVEYDPVKGADVTLHDFTREYGRSVAARGPVEVAKSTTVATSTYANTVTAMYLGDEFDTVPRWGCDQVPVEVGLLPADDTAWPRLFPHRAGHVDPPLGRLVLVTDIDPRWNLHDKPDYPGRLVGAQLLIERGRIRLVADVIQRVPAPNGPDYARDPALATSVVPGGATIADAAALGATIAQGAGLTFADLRLVDAP